MVTLALLIILLWSLRIIRNILSYVHLWWVKEYRFDRMLIHLKTSQGKKILFIGFHRPLISPKTIALSISLIFSLVVIYFSLPFYWLIKLVIVDVLTFPVSGFWVGMLKIPTYIYHEILIFRATKKLRQHTFKHVIGITGSYGKTSTKEFLATILETKFTVLKTETSKNSPIAVAELVLSKLRPEHEIFVVEMAAYKKGEIKRMTGMVRPDIGIITAINEQHQDLFGTLENTMKAKYELVEGLSGGKIAIFNADNKYTTKMSTWAKKDNFQVFLYTQEKNNTVSNQIIKAEDIIFHPDHLVFKVEFHNEEEKVTAQVLGEHQVNNILAAMLAAINLGMTLEEVAQAAGKIKPFTKTMEPVAGIPGVTFINDTFNNNTDASKAAIAYLSHLKGRKILVFQPMIELGKFAINAHQEVGKYAAEVCDDIILTSDNFFKDIEQGIKSVSSKIKFQVLTPLEAAKYIKRVTKKGDTVLFKGKEAEGVLKTLAKHV